MNSVGVRGQSGALCLFVISIALTCMFVIVNFKNL